MKQVLRRGFKQIVVEDVPEPLVPAHHVLIRPHYSLISSGTETASIHPDVLKVVADNPSHLKTLVNIAKIEGPVHTIDEVRAKFEAYAVLGYSGAGVVVEKHATVTDIEIGDLVAYGGEGTGHGESIVTGRNLVARIPENLPLDQAAFATLGSIAMNAVRTAEIGMGDVVAIIGLGLVGQLISQLVRAAGGHVLGLDLKCDRVDLARSLGADYGFSDSGSSVESVLSVTGGRGADCVIVAAASRSSAPASLALKACRDRGRIVVVGSVVLEFPWLEMYLKEIKLSMSRAYGPGSYDKNYETKGQDYPISYVRWTENRNMEEFLRIVASGRVLVEPLVSHRLDLEQAAQAYSTIMDPAANSLAVLLKYPQAERPSTAPHAPAQRRIEMVPSSPKLTVSLALVGAAGIARWAHMPAVKKIKEAGLRAIYSSNGARGRTYAKRYGAAYFCSDYDHILNDKDVDAVMIVGRNQHHAPQALAALYAGKHVFVEKPMAITIQECRDLEIAVRQTGKQVVVGFNRRFAPDYVGLKRQLAKRSGPAVLSMRVNSPGISGAFWMADPAIGGAILGEACHFADLAYWLLESEPVSVSAYSLPTDTPEPVGSNNICANFRFEDGSIATLNYTTIGTKSSQGERVEFFAQGMAGETRAFKELTIHGSILSNKRHLFPQRGYDCQMAAFLGSILDDKPQKVTVRDGSRSTIACVKMLESAKSGQPCAIDLDQLLGVN